MKHFLLFGLLFTSVTVFAQTVIFTESFEAPGGFVLDNSGQDGQDFFDRTDLPGAPATEVFTYSGFDGSFFIAGEDIDGIPGATSSVGTVTISGIDITGQTNLGLIGAFASGTNIDIDQANDQILIEAQIDGGGFVRIGSFEGAPGTYIGGTAANPANGQFAEDTNGDGDGDGTLLNGTFTDFTFPITGTGTTLDIRISMNLDSGDEEGAFDNIRIVESLVLPVELATFNAAMLLEGNQLTWTTTQEQNNDYFQVQRSTNARDWTTIGQVAGNGTTETETNYEFLDREPATGMNYYRLQQFDYDGASEIHRTISVRNGAETGPISVFPNPVQEELTIRSSGAATVVVTDHLGRTVSTVRFDATETPFQMDTREWAIGTYFISVRNAEGVRTVKVVKQ